MSYIIKSINDLVFSNSFWFPANRTWDDFQMVPDGAYFPQLIDLLVPFPLAFALIIIRYIVEKYVLFKNFVLVHNDLPI